jgi:hypothetical protein
MMFWTKFSFVLALFRDMFFDKKGETKFATIEFNARKFTIFMLCMFSLGLNSFLLNRVLYFVPKVQEQEKALRSCGTGQGVATTQWTWLPPNVVIPFRDQASALSEANAVQHEDKKH